jgi:hypothetical protein
MADEAANPGANDDFALSPADGPGRQRIQAFLEPPRIPEDPPLPPKTSEYQFRLTDILIVTAGVGLGLAGGSWMPRDIFAAVLGLVTLLGLMLVHVYPPESRLGKVIWGTLVLAYFISVGAAILRPTVADLDRLN